ncbi:hypothetical protein [Streptomyces alfalfae]|uniref:Uncharacterized protein n=1 Tax=Streptomyces alfalfae TaxID=1642299 RepID=A0A7T4PGI2_9ACTN|nr:hypothetical protein [Streptomyces alfalfae]QQC89860.1 hypothetical protein I8755_16635 [Streptomyces alfalfae]
MSDHRHHLAEQLGHATVEETAAAYPPAPLPPAVISAILRDSDSPLYPSKIVVFCDECGAEDARDYMVSTEQTSAERLEVARAHLRAQGWRCDESGDYCTEHASAEETFCDFGVTSVSGSGCILLAGHEPANRHVVTPGDTDDEDEW